MADPFELASALLMFYTGLISFYVAKRASVVGLQYLLLSLLLGLMVFFHGAHHLFVYLHQSGFEEAFEFGASFLALALAIDYAYLSRRQ